MSATNDTVELAEPIEQLTGEQITSVPADQARIAAAMAETHPPTNQRVLARAIDYWTETAGPNDPITQSLVSWLWYLGDEDRTQIEAGMTFDQHQALRDRLNELGIEYE